MKQKRILIFLLAIGFMWMGLNHFRRPENFFVLMPPYLPFPHTLNLMAGALEILFGLGILFTKTRKLSAYGLILLLITFFSVHIYMIRISPFELNGIHISPLISWIRLLLQFPLIWLVWLAQKTQKTINFEKSISRK